MASQLARASAKMACSNQREGQRVPNVVKYLRFARRATSTSPIITGTSIKGPITAANAAPLSIPNVATATAIANSKLLEAAVNDSVAHCGYVAPTRLLSANDTANMIAK